MILPDRRSIMCGRTVTNGIHDTDQIGLDCFRPRFGRCIEKRTDRPLQSCRADQYVQPSVVRAHPINSGGHLLKIPNVRANTKRDAACMFDFKVRKIQFRLASRDQSYTCALVCKTNCQTLSDTSARARDQYAFIF